MKKDRATCRLCRGPFDHAVKLARTHGSSVESAQREHRRVHELTREAARLPGGAVGLVKKLSGVRVQAEHGQARLAYLVGNGKKGGRIDELRRMIANYRAEAERLEGEIRELPPEARVDPLAAVREAQTQLDVARRGGNLEAIRAAATEVSRLQAKADTARANREKIQNQISTATAAAARGAASSLAVAFRLLAGKLGLLVADPAFLSAPELLPRREIDGLRREGEKLIAGILALGSQEAPGLGDLFRSVPAPLLRNVSHLAGVGPSPTGAAAERATI